MSTTVAETAAHLARRAAAERRALEAWAAGVRARLPEAARLLRGDYGATRVWLFGSFAQGGVHAGSDVDLAVEGLSEAAHYRAMARVAGVLGAEVDLVRVEEAPPRLRARITAEGARL